MITKNQLQDNARLKLNAIKALYNLEFYDNVVSDSGYVLEFGLKAAICKHINNTCYPENDRAYRVHSAEKLIDLSGLRSSLEIKKATNVDFFIYWSLLSSWDVNFRYNPPGTNGKVEANDYITALDHGKDGVFTWIKKHW